MKQRNRDSFLNKIIIILVILIILVIGILIYNTFHYGYEIELLGGNAITIYVNDYYQDPGYKAYNRSGKDVTKSVKVNGSVDTSKEGIYEIIYQIGGIKEIRTINVKYDLQNDITLSLVGDNPKYLLKDVTYSFDDCKAYDKVDGDITSKIVVNSNVNFNIEGDYKVEYSVINSRGVIKSITRKVIVYDIKYVLKEEIMDNKHVTNIIFDEAYYQKVKLPDGSFVITNNVNYTFNENGEYILEVYDKYNNIKKIRIIVSKIDKIAPTGTCVVNLYDNNSKVIVNANDNQSIKGYIYNYGNKKSDLLASSEFIYNDMINEASVTIYDMANNNININCEVKDLSTHYPRIYTTEYSSYNYKLYIPPTLTKRNKLPLVIFLHGSGECGSDPNRVNANSFPKYIKEGTDYNFIMAAPQMSSEKCGSSYFVPGNVKKIIDDLVSRYPIDENRIVITGFSLGARNAYNMIKKYPTFFAGAVTIASFINYTDELLNTDIWAFYGTKDGTYANGKKMMDQVIKGNPNSKFTSFPNEGHNVTELVFKDPKVIEWIMNLRRK